MSKLADFCISITDGEHGSVINDPEGKFYLLANQNIVNGEIKIFEDDRRISKSEFERVNKRCNLQKGDVLISTVGTLGKLAVIQEENPNYVFQRSVGIIKPNPDKLLGSYLKFLLSTSAMMKRLLNNSKGAVQKCIFLDDLKNLQVDIPPLDAQKQTVEILLKIEDKIRLNNKINDNLYDLIKLIYEKTFYNHNKCDTQWVQEFSINIPKDWKVVKLSTLIDNISTGLNPRNNFTLTDKGYKYVTVKNLTSKGSLDFQGCDYIDEEARKIVHSRSQVSKGDILFASISPLGRCYAVNENPTEWEINESVFSITPKNESLQLYLYMYLTSDYFIKKAEHSSTGSIFNGIRISTLEDMPIILPTENILDKFNDIVRPLFNKRDSIDKENAKLKEIRNYILPMLMNGQIVFDN